MKRGLSLAVFAVIAAEVAGQAYDLSKYYPKYEGYRSLDYYQDTVRYLKYNWGLGAAGVYGGEQLSTFFDKFELPIYEVELELYNWRKKIGAGIITFYLLPSEKIQSLRAIKGFDVNQYVIIVMVEYPIGGKPDRRPTYDELSPYFPGLNKKGKTLYLWKDSYKEILGKCWVESVQYSYEVTGEPF